jgi:Saxitoxin biosynthesis operon protein SxtJ
MSAKKELFNPSDRMLRQFAGLWIVFFGAIAFRQFQHNRPTVAAVVAVLAVTVGPMGLFLPRWIRPIFVGWMTAAYPIGWVVSRIVLGTVFYGIFTPVALVFRLIGRDTLALKPKPAADSYWHSKAGAEKAQYLRQY